MGLKIRPLQKTFGAEISGLDLSKSLDSQTINEVKSLWHQYGLLLFRDQAMDEAEIVSCSMQYSLTNLLKTIDADCWPTATSHLSFSSSVQLAVIFT